MAFFDKKQEVIDIKLTQFGKNLLARGFFKPEFYQFFDDGILYNSECGGYTEHQNDTEDRILKETPQLKTQHLTSPVSARYATEQALIEEGKSSRFKEIRQLVIPSVQEKILMYPLSERQIQNQSAPVFNVACMHTPMENMRLSSLTGSNIQQNIPVVDLNPKYRIREDRKKIKKQKIIDKEVYVDFFSEEITFADNSKILVDSQDIILDIQELNTSTGLENFKINVYEVKSLENGEEEMIRIDSIEEINKYFHILTNEHVPEVTPQDPKARNYYKRGEE